MTVYQIGDVVLIRKNLIEVDEVERQQLEGGNYIGTVCFVGTQDRLYPIFLDEYDFAFCKNDFVGKLIGNRIVRCE